MSDFRYSVGEQIEGLTVIKQKIDRSYNLYYLKCQCGLYCRFYESELPKVNCGMCYRKNIKYPKGRPEMITNEYKEWRKKVFAKDGYKCFCCGKKYNLVAHHLDGWNWAVHLRYEYTNGITLCGGNKRYNTFGCHDLFHKYYGSGNNTKIQFQHFAKKYFGKDLS